MNRGRILVADDDQFYQEFCAEILGEEGYEVRATYTGEEALEILRREGFDIMIADLVMPGLGGIELLEKTKQINPQLDVIIITGYASVESAVQCLKRGAADYLTKPLNPEELKITVKRTIELRHLFDENAELKNILSLYEACQRVSLCLELDKLYGLSLDAMLQAIHGDLGLSLAKDQGSWKLKSYRGMDEEEAEMLMERLIEQELKEFPSKVTVLDEDRIHRIGGDHLRANSALLLPIKVPPTLQGLIVAFRKDADNNFGRMEIGTARFIAEQVHLSFENAIKYVDAQRLVFIDDLTGLFNTRYLDMSLQTELKRSRRFKTHLSVLFVDLDYFKNVNDEHGHLIGSKVLIETAKVIKRCVREIDIAIRYGGDEFIVILVETDRAGADKVAERIREMMEKHRFRVRDDLELRLTCCVGISTYPNDAESQVELIHLADKAMYRGKETTRNVVYAASSL